MNLARKLITGLTILLSWILYLLSHLSLRDKKIWVFIGWHKIFEREIFADNPKYLFLHVANNHPNIRAIWIGGDDKICTILNNAGYESYSIKSIAGIYFSLRAKYTILGANINIENWRLSGLSKLIQLWHGDGVKKMGLITHNSPWTKEKISKIFIAPGLLKKISFLISSSNFTANNFIYPSFLVKPEYVHILGLPRYDVLFNKIPGSEIDLDDNLSVKIENIKQKGTKRLILYAPTFRRGKDPSSPLSTIDFPKMEEFLSLHNYHLVISLHPKFSTSKWIPDQKFSHITFSNPGYDKYPLFNLFDILITDYSSIFLEFLLLDKPTIFYTYDYDEYAASQGLHKDFWDNIPGQQVQSFNELLEALKTDIVTLKKKNSLLQDKFFKYKDGNSSERITQSILSEI